MTEKEAFIKIVQTEIFDRADIYAENYPNEYELATSFWDDFKDGKVKISGAMTESGKNILTWMQQNEEQLSNTFTSKIIAEALFTSGRVIAGSMRKLVADGFVDKTGKDPVHYSLTEKGEDTIIA